MRYRYRGVRSIANWFLSFQCICFINNKRYESFSGSADHFLIEIYFLFSKQDLVLILDTNQVFGLQNCISVWVVTEGLLMFNIPYKIAKPELITTFKTTKVFSLFIMILDIPSQ